MASHQRAQSQRAGDQVESQGTGVWSPPEYVIVRKLEYYRDSGSDRHLRDIGMMLQLSADQIDQGEVERWVRELDLGAEWREARDFLA